MCVSPIFSMEDTQPEIKATKYLHSHGYALYRQEYIPWKRVSNDPILCVDLCGESKVTSGWECH